jgi:hypothetical protein
MLTVETTFPYYRRLQDILQPYSAYLVGGAVRDRLLGLPVHDLDFCLPDRTLEAARQTADRLGGAYFTLDDQRDAGRVILEDSAGHRHRIDFTTFQGEDLEADLQARDFTLTAMAVAVDQPDQLIDPLGGQEDLRKKLIRSCSEGAMQADPVRILRGVRMAADYGFRIESRTREAIRQAVSELSRVSPERIRDELFRILGSTAPVTAVRALNQLDVSPGLFGPDRKVPEESLRVLNNLERFWDALGEEYDPESGATWRSGLLVTYLGRYREQIQEHLRQEPVWERGLRELLGFNVLVSGMKNESAEEMVFENSGRRFRLSSQEIQRMAAVRRGAASFLASAREGEQPSALPIHRYFKSFGGAGVEAVFLALAETDLRQAPGGMDNRWADLLSRARAYLEAWWEQHDRVVSPPRLVDGHELQQALDLAPGPEIGRILRAVQEGQVSGRVQDRAQALELARTLMEDGDS